MRNMRWVVVLGVVLGVLGPAAINIGCGSDSSNAPKRSGNLVIVGHIDSALSDEEKVQRIDVVVSNPSFGIQSQTVVLTSAQSTDVWTGRIDNLPAVAGYELSATATGGDPDAGTFFFPLFTADARNVTVADGADTPVTLNFHTVSFPSSFLNSAPFITSLTSTKSVAAPNETLTVSATAIDPDFDPLTYTWSADNGAIVGDAHSAVAQWQAGPGAGPTPAKLTVQVDDGRGGVSVGYILINVAVGAVTLNMRFFERPQVTALTFTGDPRPGNYLTFSATVQGGSSIYCDPSDTDYSCISTPNYGSPNAWWFNSCNNDSTYSQWTPGPESTLSTQLFISPTINGTSCSVSLTLTDQIGATNTGTVFLQLGQPAVMYGDPTPPDFDAGPPNDAGPPFDAGPDSGG